ncbi:transcription antitermination factor NusB [Peptoniphilus catoniae]|uniref:transcription antitermination factor NusB n=1 Tax=Peptoniphilus catoniae TaxID=1660341 RepID=UPI0010FDD6B2|nr:transcription antitermination factor NusB [Peptoniphilus catoniae]
MSRKKSRIGQMQVLFQMDINDDFSIEGLETFLENFDFSKTEIDYIEKTVPVILEHIEDIDNKIIENLHTWSFNRLAKVDRSILRIAVYELLYRDDIPSEVSINEAVEISKEFGSDESPKFINGILGSIYRNL